MASLSKIRQQEIDQVINDRMFEKSLSYPTSSIKDILESFDIAFSAKDFDSMENGEKVRGFIENNEGKIKITVDVNDSQERQFFTIAHELGHYFLHYDSLLEGKQYYIDKYNYAGEGEEQLRETEANYFAASLLVPAELLRDAIAKGGTIVEIAEYFNVSPTVIKKRMEWLKTN